MLEAWHLTAAEHLALVRDVLIPVARLHASTELACSGPPRCVLILSGSNVKIAARRFLHAVIAERVVLHPAAPRPQLQARPIFQPIFG